MNALYIRGNNRRIHLIRRWRHELLGRKLSGQDGFFVASLYTAFRVVEHDLTWLGNHTQTANKKFDVIFINFKCDAANKGITCSDLTFLAKISAPKVLVVTNAQAGKLPSDSLLDLFDIVFKREHYIDLDRYPVSSANKEKIRNTMLGCPLIKVTHKNVRNIEPKAGGFRTPSQTFSHDLFFSGKTTAPIRLNAMERLHKEGFNILGGLNIHKKYANPIPPSLTAPHFSRNEYIRAVRCSKINLALEGYGEYTFRHNEILFLCSFMLSTPLIRGLQLPIHLIENKHYVCFENLDDLTDKVRYYLSHESERQEIAQAGRTLFEKEYDFKKHGEYIKQAIQNQPF